MFRCDPNNVTRPRTIVSLMAEIFVRWVRYEAGLVFLVAICLPFAGCATGSKGHLPGDDELANFWPEFRAAAVAEDANRLEKLTTFPLKSAERSIPSRCGLMTKLGFAA